MHPISRASGPIQVILALPRLSTQVLSTSPWSTGAVRLMRGVRGLDSASKARRYAEKTCNDYVALATPVSNATGTRNFCSTSDGLIRFQTGNPLTLPMSVSECKTWPPLK